MRFNPSSKIKNFGNIDCNGRYVILNHHSGEVRLFHRNKPYHPFFNPKFSFKTSLDDKPNQVLNYELYYPFDYGKKEHCIVSIFLSESFTRNIRRMINDFNLEVLFKKKLEIKEHYYIEIEYLNSLLKIDDSSEIIGSNSNSESYKKSGKYK